LRAEQEEEEEGEWVEYLLFEFSVEFILILVEGKKLRKFN
jgi:hypothetical protein